MIRVRDIQAIVASHYGLSVEQLLSRDSHREVVRPRQIAMTLSRRMARTRTLPFIAEQFQRHHTTVMGAISTIDKVTAKDADTRRSVRYLAVEIGRAARS